MSASGLPGRRVDAMRAGIMTIMSRAAIGFCGPGWNASGKRWAKNAGEFGALYGLPERRQTGYLVRRRTRRCFFPIIGWRSGSLDWMDSFELNKILGAVLGTCLVLLSLNIAAGAIFHARQAGQAGLRDRRSGRAGGSRRVPPNPRSRSAAAGFGRCRKGRGGRQEMRRLPHLRQGRPQPRRSESVRRHRARQGRSGRLQLFGRDEGARAASGRLRSSTNSWPIPGP